MEISYFNHSTGARCEPKVRAILHAYGVEGYGHFFLLLEQIYSSHSPILDLGNRLMAESIAAEHCMTVDELFDFISDCCSVGLFNEELWNDMKHLTSDGITENFAYVNSKRAAGKKGGESRRKKPAEHNGEQD